MDWSDTPEQAAFRDDVQTLIREKLPERYQQALGSWEEDRKSEDAGERQAAQDWSDALVERGWFAPQWPKEYGGGGLSSMEQFIFNQEMSRADAPSVGGQGTRQLGATLIVHGTEEQKAEHLPRILNGEVNWRQGYSEPGAGSDLASLQTRAVKDGDDYVINGQKIWTSGAHLADWLYVLVRTDPDAPKHRGISFLIMEKETPGITVRPLINMGWTHGFNETFFEDVRTPAKNLIGEENRGWYVGATLLDFERSNISGAEIARRNIAQLVEHVQDGRGEDAVAAGRLRPAAARGGGLLHRHRGAVPVQLPHHLDAERGPDPQLRGIDLEALQLRAQPEAGARRDEGLRAALEPLGRGR